MSSETSNSMQECILEHIHVACAHLDFEKAICCGGTDFMKGVVFYCIMLASLN